MKSMFKLLLLISVLIISGCSMYTRPKVIEVPVYIDKPLPKLKNYNVNSTFKFTGLINDGDYVKVPKTQFEKFISIKIELEKQLKKSNDQINLYNKMITKQTTKGNKYE